MLPPVSPFLFEAFGRYANWYVPRSFHAVRLLGAGPPPTVTGMPIVVYLNHPSWWDPLICLLFARRLWPDRRHYAPIDAVAIGRYRFFQRLGFFGVEQDSVRGSLTFLRTGREILRQTGSMLWVTSQGRFTDIRQRPIKLRPGLGHLLRRDDSTMVLPLALEYCYWDERLPEALAAFGEPIVLSSQRPRRPAELTSMLERRLEQTADQLASGAMSRDPSRFFTMLSGKAGISFVYDFWLRLRALARGEQYHREHGTGLR